MSNIKIVEQPIKEEILSKAWFYDKGKYPRLRAVAKEYDQYSKFQLTIALVRVRREMIHLRERDKWETDYCNKKVKNAVDERATAIKELNIAIQETVKLKRHIKMLKDYCDRIQISAVTVITKENQPWD